MLYKKSKLYSILTSKCPRCSEGAFFKTNNPYNLKKFDKMHMRCPACNEDFERETGFYYGAMYVSYGLSVAFGLSVFLIMCMLLNFTEIEFLFTFIALLIISMPVLYRLSRLVWINLFVHNKKKEC